MTVESKTKGVATELDAASCPPTTCLIDDNKLGWSLPSSNTL